MVWEIMEWFWKFWNRMGNHEMVREEIKRYEQSWNGKEYHETGLKIMER